MAGESGYARRLEDDESVSDAVLRTVAAVSDRPMADLPPLQASVDADSLNQLLASSRALESLQLRYAGYAVTIEPERIRVRPDR